MDLRSLEPQRSDAQRNRERILTVALAELTRSPDTPLSSIAKKARVGQGTFYRNFPSREALIMAVYQQEVKVLTDGAARLLEAEAPEQALRLWVDQLARFAVAKISLAAVMRQIVGSSDGRSMPGYALVVQAIEALLTANHAAGTIRTDITADDFIRAIAGIWQLDADGDCHAQASKVLDIVLAGVLIGNARTST